MTWAKVRWSQSPSQECFASAARRAVAAGRANEDPLRFESIGNYGAQHATNVIAARCAIERVAQPCSDSQQQLYVRSLIGGKRET